MYAFLVSYLELLDAPFVLLFKINYFQASKELRVNGLKVLRLYERQIKEPRHISERNLQHS